MKPPIQELYLILKTTTIDAASQVLGNSISAIAQTCAEKLDSIAYQLTTALPDYRTAVDERISKDKSLVEKKIPSQIRSLIVEPIRELEKQGKRIQPKAIFIDGLDECEGKDAQAEIIEIIASSVREGSTPLGHLQSRWTSHSIHIQAGQYRFCHSFYRTPYLLRGRWRDQDASLGWIQEHTWSARLSATAIIMANWQQYLDPCQCGSMPICSPCCCPASCRLSTRLAIPWTIAVRSRYPLRCKRTGSHITLFTTWCFLYPHHGADSGAHSPVCTTLFPISGRCHHILLHK